MFKIFFLFILFANVSPLPAQWTSDISQNTPVAIAPDNQLGIRSIPDGDGGMILVWEDRRFGGSSNRAVYCQRIDRFGFRQWGDSTGLQIAMTITGTASVSRFYDICSDGKGGAIILWSEFSPSFTVEWLKAQRISKEGNKLWGANGIQITNEGNKQEMMSISPDNTGGCYYAYQTSELNISDFELKANRLDSNGVKQWGNGIFICQAQGIQTDLHAVTSSDGGFIVTWRDPRTSPSTDFDIYAQKLNASGSILWTANGQPVCTFQREQNYQYAYPDNSGGVFIVWSDWRLSDSATTRIDVFAQRLNSNGNSVMFANGVPVCTAPESQFRPVMTTDGKGGVIATWNDFRNGAVAPFNIDIYAQRIDTLGNMLWQNDGVQVCGVQLSQNNQKITTDGNSGANITWDDRRAGTSIYDIYSQRIDSSGNLLWNPEGVAISTAPGNQYSPSLVFSGDGAIIAFEDARNGSNNYDLFAQKVLLNGSVIVSVNNTSSNVPESFELFQNYPNPFNPGTVISYSLKVNSDVTLKVFDLLGREIATLVNEKQVAGVYNYEFQISDYELGSGVYFYTLKARQAGSLAENFVSTKKMILLK
jgi:hypothetical protein